MKRWLILYDIRKPRRLAKVAKILQGFGLRVQKSVFEAEADQKAVAECCRRINGVIDPAVDYVLFFSICQRDWEKREKCGKNFEELPAVREYEVL